MSARRRTTKGGRGKSPATSAKQVQIPDELDPRLPLPAHTELPVVHQGDGDIILNDTRMMVVEIPYRAFYMMWEYAERRAEKIYPQYINRTDGMEKAAFAMLEAVHAFRSSFRGEVLPILDEQEARRLRLLRTQMLEAQAKKSKSPGEPSKSVTEPAVDEGSISETSEPSSKKKVRCREVYDGDPGDRCLGPESHAGKHKDKYGNRWSSE